MVAETWVVPLIFNFLNLDEEDKTFFFLICKTTKIHWSDLVRPAITCTGFGECREYRLSSDPPPCVLLFGAVLLCTYLNVCLTIHPSSYLTICLSNHPSLRRLYVHFEFTQMMFSSRSSHGLVQSIVSNRFGFCDYRAWQSSCVRSQN